ncbi:histidine phosphatase family protein [Actinomyces lilanjuaniae]|uniref:Histidine phosphatase family protein n=1 Tax=Actinomyces lilanjuaniae TaxID=2321394 RepID=A0ABM6Z3Q4_9ACTO|nr:histidine phosphatase family protein [Actinomyces lilanjuaniae]AYD89997.1 histidine phosphatase family protein [Actinomyces lilanjuaniae]
MTEVVLWRHGQTDYNLSGRVQGQVDVPLNETGAQQARQAAAAVAALGPTRIVSSPLGRAWATAQALAQEVGLPVETEDRLAERSFGKWEGLTREQIEAGWPEQYRRWREGRDVPEVGVETRGRVARRVGEAVAELAGPGREETTDGGVADGSTDGGGVVVVVSHGSATRLGTCHLLGLDPVTWFGLRGMGNGHYARLRTQDREPGWAVLGWDLFPQVYQA